MRDWGGTWFLLWGYLQKSGHFLPFHSL
jgi:hypothetical protein